MELEELKGVGKKRISALNEAGIFTCTDFLNFYPIKYYNFNKSEPFDATKEENYLICATTSGDAKAVFFKGHSYTLAPFEDEKSQKSFKAIWYNQPFMKNNLVNGQKYLLYGKPNSKKQFVVQKSFRAPSNGALIIPIYKSIAGFSQNLICQCIKQILDNTLENSLVPESIVALPLLSAYKGVHCPQKVEDIEECKDRLSLEDLLLFAGLDSQKMDDKKERTYLDLSVQDFQKVSPFVLSPSQKTAIAEIFADLKSPNVMNRVLFGDVGSGKTLVAFACCWLAIKSRAQACIVVPTEILANQHFASAQKMFENFKVAFLHSKLSTKERRNLLEDLRLGNIDLLIATHSVFNSEVQFKDLAICITDEQHRFGVAQRASLQNKNTAIDQLFLSATPIPRSLALVLFGGLKTSRLERREDALCNIKTSLVGTDRIASMWQYILNSTRINGRKCFVIVPRIDENDADGLSPLASIQSAKDALLAAGATANEIAIINGKQSKEVQQAEMENFAKGDKRFLVATTVVEVGVDVPSASYMVIFNADRFGLATLHQLRGRIGRDGAESYCFCLTDSASDFALKRLKLFKSTLDGAKIAEEDLRLRGSGTMYGTKQHGMNEVFSNMNFSIELFERAKDIFAKLTPENQAKVVEKAKQKYAKLFEQVVLN